MADIPRIVSVDDHVIEPAHVWQDRLPEKYKDVGPRVVQERGNMDFVGGNFTYEPDPEGCYDPKARLEDMDVNHVEASLCFPSFPGSAARRSWRRPIVSWRCCA